MFNSQLSQCFDNANTLEKIIIKIVKERRDFCNVFEKF